MAGPITLPFVTTFNDKGVKQGQASLSSLAQSSIAGALSVGLVVDQLGKAVRAAAEDQKSQEQLELAVRNNTSANTLQIAEMERSIGKMESQKAVADDQLRPAMASLVRATGDVTKSQELLNLALDISAATGRDLEGVSIALAKAQTGNITALTRLGIPLDAAAVKSKDLDAIQKDLAIRFAGASDAAAASAEGGMKKLQIALDNTYESVGMKLLPVLGDYVTVLNDIASKALNAEGSQNKFVETFVKLYGYVGPGGGLLKGIGFLNKLVGNYADTIDNARENQYDYTNINQRMNMGMKELTVTTVDNEKKTKSNTDAKKKAKEAAKEYADTLRDRVQTALDTVTDKVQAAQDAFDGFKDSVSSQFSGFASLSDAVRTVSEAEEDYAESLSNRRDAYSEVAQATKNVEEAMKQLVKTQGKDDPEAIASATEDLAEARLKLNDANLAVAESETKVGEANKKRVETTVIGSFNKQIAAAKKFGENIGVLIKAGLGRDGLAQILNLGPVAGVEVTDNMIAGSFDEFQTSMGQLAGIAQSAGLTSANAFFGGALGGAQDVQGQVANYQIIINAGLVSNPAQVGRDIIEAIKAAERVSGQVFVSV